MSRRFLLGIGLAALALAAAIALLGREAPAYDPERLENLALVFARQAQPVRKGRPGFDMPPRAEVDRELDYLESLAELLEQSPADCGRAAQVVLRRFESYRAEAGTSLFQQPARWLAAREGQNLVADLSDQVSIGRRFAPERRRVPTDPDARLELAQRRWARKQQVERGLTLLERLARAAAAFGDACPAESEALHTALGYFEN
jgi:hypothetical protein